MTRGELNYIELYEEKLKSKLAPDEINFIAKSKKKASMRRAMIGLGMVAVGLIISLAVFSIWQWIDSEKKKNQNSRSQSSGNLC